MLFPVTIYNNNGEVKEVISKEMLHRRHWNIFHKNENIQTLPSTGKQTVYKDLKKKLDLQFMERLINSHN